MRYNINEKMEKVLNDEEQECSEQTTELLKNIVAETKLVRNCMVYDKAGNQFWQSICRTSYFK